MVSFVPLPEVAGVSSLPRHVAAAATAPADHRSAPGSATAPRGALPMVAAAGAVLAAKQKRRATEARTKLGQWVLVRRLGPTASAELLEVRSAEQGTASNVKPWQFLSGIAKDAARAWFVQRAEERGIAWRFSVEKMQAQQEELEAKYHELRNESVDYPSYYVQPFHGYDEGNLSWRAAHELEAATQSMCLGYYDGMTWQDAQEEFRGAARQSIRDYWQGSHGAFTEPQSLLDVGCRLDLSPYFLSVAQQNFPQLRFVHANAEDTGLPSNSYDMVTLNFLLHELPLEATRNVLSEALRLLKPGGALAVLDVDPKRLAALPPFRRWAFQVTEPWCKDGEYFSLDLVQELRGLGFEETTQSSNDPVNTLTLARKRMEN
eukprot:s2407_g3.t1